MRQHLINWNIQQFHLPCHFGQYRLEELAAPTAVDTVTGVGCHKVAQPATVVDYPVARQLVVSLYGSVGVDTDGRGILSHRRNPLVWSILASENIIRQPVGHLQIYCLVAIEIHNLTVVLVHGVVRHVADARIAHLARLCRAAQCYVARSIIIASDVADILQV